MSSEAFEIADCWWINLGEWNQRAFTRFHGLSPNSLLEWSWLTSAAAQSTTEQNHLSRDFIAKSTSYIERDQDLIQTEATRLFNSLRDLESFSSVIGSL